MMGKNDPGISRYEESQLTENQSNGLDAHKRSTARSSRKSRSERASYLMATTEGNQLDLEVIKQLNKQTSPSSDNIKYKKQDLRTDSPDTAQAFIKQQPFRSSGDNQANVTSSLTFFDTPVNMSSKILRSNFNKSRGSSKGGNSSRGNWKQTYTEVTLPMKTSPAFEYILKDHKRRNRRCCLWLLYSTLITICIAIIVFCSTHLALRYCQS